MQSVLPFWTEKVWTGGSPGVGVLGMGGATLVMGVTSQLSPENNNKYTLNPAKRGWRRGYLEILRGKVLIIRRTRINGSGKSSAKILLWDFLSISYQPQFLDIKIVHISFSNDISTGTLPFYALKFKILHQEILLSCIKYFRAGE